MSKRKKTPASAPGDTGEVAAPKGADPLPEAVESPSGASHPERTSYTERDAQGRLVYREKSIVSGNWITMYLD